MYTRLELSSNFSATPRRLIQYRTVYRPSYRSLNKIDRGAIVETKELALEMISNERLSLRLFSFERNGGHDRDGRMEGSHRDAIETSKHIHGRRLAILGDPLLPMERFKRFKEFWGNRASFVRFLSLRTNF